MTMPTINDTLAKRFIFFAVITAVLTAMSTIPANLFGFISSINFMDTVILLSLAFGVYIKKSRACATILLVCHLGIRLDIYEHTDSLYAAFGPVPIGIAWIYILAILGTFALRANKTEPDGTFAEI